MFEDSFSKQYVKKFWEKGVIVDRIKVGYRTSNTGPMISKLFEDPESINQTLDLGKNLVENPIRISRFINQNEPVNINLYKKIAIETVNILSEKYSFCSISPHINKILIHGRYIVEHVQKIGFGPGITSEQSQEGCNKKIRKIKEDFTRKTSFKDNTEDIASRLLAISDPLLNLI